MYAKQAFARTVRRSALAACVSLLAAFAVRSEAAPFIPDEVNSSTIPANGDVNPYGVAFVPEGFPTDGIIAPGDVAPAGMSQPAAHTAPPA